MSANNFKLTLDTLAPNGSFTNTSPYYFADQNALVTVQNQVTLTFNIGDASYMKVWYDLYNAAWYSSHIERGTNGSGEPIWQAKSGLSSAESTAASAIATKLNWVQNDNTKIDWIPASSSYLMTFPVNGSTVMGNNYYAHVIFVDDVGNMTDILTSCEIRAEMELPTISSLYAEDKDSHSTAYTNGATFTLHVTASDTGTVQSGLKQIEITGNIENSPIVVASSSFSAGGTYSQDLTFTSGATAATDTFCALHTGFFTVIFLTACFLAGAFFTTDFLVFTFLVFTVILFFL